MGFIRNLNFRRHTHTLRSLDYENAPPSLLREDGDTGGRLSSSLYEGTSRVPPPDHLDEAPGPHNHAMPDEKPDPAAQWDDVRGCWIKWDAEVGDWVDVPAGALSAAPDDLDGEHDEIPPE